MGLIIIAIGIAAILIYFTILGYRSKSGRAPGMVSEKLAPCPESPNCVCSEFPEDEAHDISAVEYSGTASKKAWAEMLQVIRNQGGEIIVSNETYLAATFSVSWFGFIDDLECRLDTSKSVIHIRSASRVGYSDLGINKERVHKIYRLFNQRLQQGL